MIAATLPRRDAAQRLLCALALFVAALSANLAPAAAQAQSGGDPRMRTIVYNPNQIIPIRGHLGYQMLIEFDPNERIENVSIGDSLAWQVTPNRRATLLFVKPVVLGAATNMTVVTTLRRYAFELTSREASGPSDRSIIYGIRFVYNDMAPPAPVAVDAPQPPPPSVARLNFAYTVNGSDRIAPVRVFDDGAMTFFQFSERSDAPAIFVIGTDGEEELVNVQARGDYTVVEAIAERYVLRLGRARATVRNDAYAAQRAAATASALGPAP
ncbi:MAG: TrbG/VirB9 family P-type conjugative transfer protein [Hyphomonadaceae bacterium]|nr:TrbG/VirB9 family P-type conjugative transfer protein [Hyphomonadaceae bacterium]